MLHHVEGQNVEFPTVRILLKGTDLGTYGHGPVLVQGHAGGDDEAWRLALCIQCLGGIEAVVIGRAHCQGHRVAAQDGEAEEPVVPCSSS